jgi:hypothetical protein
MALKDVRDTAIGGGLRYPYSSLTDNTDYLLINIVDYIPTTTKTGTKDAFIPGKLQGTVLKNTKVTSSTYGNAIRERDQLNNKNTKSNYGSIILPIPSNIQDGNSVNFGPGSLDGLTASVLEYATNMMGSNINSISDIGPLITKALQGGSSLLTQPGAFDYFMRNIASSAANIPFGGNLTPAQLLARQTGNILNPNMELLFEGVNLRSFKFSFKMTPRNKEEAESVKKIIRTFKKNMTPQAEGSLYLKTPNIFELSYMKGANPHPFLHKFKQCALTDMSVNYTGEGTYATYGGPDDQGGGTPVSMVMDLGFKELEPIYSGDYDNEAGKRGVGF